MAKRQMLNGAFFNRSTVEVARELLGKYLVRRFLSKSASGPGKSARHEVVVMITETEAYDGFRDRASHASRGETTRNAPMFGEPGRWYVYFTYGMHWMLNIVTREAGYPAAALIRGVKIPRGAGINGPARLTKFLKVDGRLSGKAALPKNGLWLEDRGFTPPARTVRTEPRVGVAYAGSYWAKRKWRFSLPPEMFETKPEMFGTKRSKTDYY